MDTITEQLEQEKQAKKENLKDLFYVDDCNNCSDPGVRGTYGKHYTPCNHPWYCHHKEPVRTLESQIALINHNVAQRGYWCSHEVEEIRKLGRKKWRLTQKNRKKWSMSS